MEIPIHFQQVYLFPNDAAKWLFTTEPMICCGDFVVLKKTNWWFEIKVNYFLKTLIALWRTKLTNLKMQSKWKALRLRIWNLWWINLGSPPPKSSLTLTSHKCWVKGGIGRQFPRNLHWSPLTTTTVAAMTTSSTCIALFGVFLCLPWNDYIKRH